MTCLVQTAFACLSEVKAWSLVNFMQAKEKESDTGVITLGKHHVHLAPGETVRVKCAIHFGPVEEDLPIVFEPKAKGAWPEGLEVKESLTRIQGGSSSRIYVPVCNTGQREITLRQRTELGTVELVQSVTPVLFGNRVEESEDTTDRDSGENRVAIEGISCGSLEEQEMWVPPVDLGHLSQEQAVIERSVTSRYHGSTISE